MASKYPNSGILGKNDRKTLDKHPDLSGSCEVDGVLYWISGWTKAKDGSKYISLAFKKKDAAPAKTAPKAISDVDDDLPW